MNKPLRVIASFGLILLWAFTAGVHLGDGPQAGNRFTGSAGHYSIQAPDWFAPPFRGEKEFNGFGGHSVSFLKSQSPDFIINRHAFEAHINCRISGYISFSKIILTGLSTTDIIFPFHHFW